MDIRILRKKDEKFITRKLYEQSFDDAPAFIEFYYDEIGKDNIIIVALEEEKVVSMVHLNPYTMSVFGKKEKSYYILNVATDKAYRRQGYMRTLMEKAFELMRAEGVRFCYLMPVNACYYTSLGFETLCPYEEGRPDYEEIRQNYDVYTLPTPRYAELVKKAQKIGEENNGAYFDLPDEPVIMFKVLEDDGGELMAELRAARICICDDF